MLYLHLHLHLHQRLLLETLMQLLTVRDQAIRVHVQQLGVFTQQFRRAQRADNLLSYG